MDSVRQNNAHATRMWLEAAAVSARGGFGCLFSSSGEYETALIEERCAQGRYGRPHGRWPAMMFLGCALMVVGSVLLFR